MHETPTRFDTDPEALAWARSFIEDLRDQQLRFEAQARSAGLRADAGEHRRFALLLDARLIGGTGDDVSAPFDARRAGKKEAASA